MHLLEPPTSILEARAMDNKVDAYDFLAWETGELILRPKGQQNTIASLKNEDTMKIVYYLAWPQTAILPQDVIDRVKTQLYRQVIIYEAQQSKTRVAK